MQEAAIKTSKEIYLESANEQAKFDMETANMINKELPFQLHKDYLIKVLPAKKIIVEHEVPVETGEVDEETGAMIYGAVEIKKEEIDAPLTEAIILQVPEKQIDPNGVDYLVGERVLVPVRTIVPFYLFKDTHIVQGFNIVGRIKPEMVEAAIDTKVADKSDEVLTPDSAE